MTNSDKVQRCLEAARAGYEPSAFDHARVRRSLGVRLAGIAGAATSATGAAAATGGASGGAGAGGVVAAGLGKVFLTSILWSTIGATTLVVAVEGFRGNPEQQGPHGPPVSAPAPKAKVQQAPAPVKPQVQAAPAVLEGSAVDAPSAATVREPRASNGAVEERGVVESTPPDLDPLKAELELLKQARRASESGDPRGALVKLAELDRTFPKGVLLQERAALRAIATCRVAPAGARIAASEFERSYPGSVYASKVRANCPDGSQSPAVPDTDTDVETDIEGVEP